MFERNTIEAFLRTKPVFVLGVQELLVGPIAQMLGPDRSEKHAAGMASLRPLQGGSSVVTLNAGQKRHF